MRNKTCEDAADAIIAAGGGKELIVNTLRSAIEQAWGRGYRARVADSRKAKSAQQRVKDEAFKKEMDIVDDVIRSKWS